MMKISIPEPCNENWANMLPSEKGKFCLSCQKEVVDFSVMTKHEVKDYFKGLPQNVCGRFGTKQLTVINTETPVKPIVSFKPYWVAASLFLFAKSAVSQGNFTVDSVKQKTEINKEVNIGVEKDSIKNGNKFILKGKVIDKETGETLPFVNVEVKELKIGVSTDFDGEFLLKLPKNDLVRLIVTTSFIGYESYDTVVDFSKNEILIELIGNYEMKGEVIIVSGGISYDNISYERPSIWRRIGNFFARPFRRD